MNEFKKKIELIIKEKVNAGIIKMHSVLENVIINDGIYNIVYPKNYSKNKDKRYPLFKADKDNKDLTNNMSTIEEQHTIKIIEELELSKAEMDMLNIGKEDIKNLVVNEKRMEKEREIMRINEESGNQLRPIEEHERECINENKKRILNRSELTLRSKFGAKIADKDNE